MSRQKSYHLVLGFCFALAVTGLMASATNAQTLVSAKAGLVNNVTGGVVADDGIAPMPAEVGFQLEPDFHLITNSGGRAELLLNPGSFIRVDGNTDFSMLDNSPDNMRVGLQYGTMIVEAGSFMKNEVELEVVTSAGNIRIIKNGIYRIDVGSDGRTTLRVFNGEAMVPSRNGEMRSCTKGRRADLTPGDGLLAINKFDTNDQDSFDQWSAQRASLLLAANTELSEAQDPSQVRLLTYGGSRGYGYPGWGSGFWGWNSYRSCYTFFPAPWYSGFRSPYGYGYGGCGCGNWFHNWSNWYGPGGSYYPNGGGISSLPPNGGGGGHKNKNKKPQYGPGGRGENPGGYERPPSGGGQHVSRENGSRGVREERPAGGGGGHQNRGSAPDRGSSGGGGGNGGNRGSSPSPRMDGGSSPGMSGGGGGGAKAGSSGGGGGGGGHRKNN